MPRPRPALASRAATGRPSIAPVKRVDAIDGREIGLNRLHLGLADAKLVRGLFDLRFVGRDDQIEAMLGALPCELKADAGRGTGHDGELARGRIKHAADSLTLSSGNSVMPGFSTTLMQPSFLSRNVL